MCLSITCNNTSNFETFDRNPSLEVRSVFFDILKAFNKVWHEGLLYKLKSMSISGQIYNLLENYLSSRFQRVFLNGQTSSLRPIFVGGHQGSILGPLLFLININDLKNELKLNSLPMTHLFLLLLRIRMKVLMFSTNLQSFSTWVYNWKMLFNSDSSKLAQEVLFFIKKKIQVHLTISLNNVHIERVSYHKHLGILLDEKLNFKQQIDNAISKVNKVFR